MSGTVSGSIALQAASYVPGAVIPEDVIDAWTGDDAALGRILALCDAHPLDGAALSWAARLNSGGAMWTSAPLSPLGLRRLVGRHRGRNGDSGQPKPMLERTAGGQAEFWGAYTFRRFTPWNLLVPSVVQLTIE